MAKHSERIRLLLIAEACNPTWSSVPLVGYNFARALADRDDLTITLVTHVRNREALVNDPIAMRARLHFINNEWLAGPLYRLTTLLRGGEKFAWTLNTAMSWPSHIAFEQQVFRSFRHQLDRGEFDLIHRITPLSPTMPSPLTNWTRVPVIIGPLNGGLPWPKEFPELVGQEREWMTKLRPMYKSLPYYRSTYRRAAGVIAGSRHTESEIPPSPHGLRFYMPENGIDPRRFPLADGWSPPTGRFRFVSVGRLVPLKGLLLTLEAMAGSKFLRACELLIVGDGPQRPELEEYVRRENLAETVKFVGWCDQSTLAQHLRASQAFVFPSVRDFGGGAVLEAMASGLPTIVVNYGGPAELATPECGILLPLQCRNELIQSLRAGMERLAGDYVTCQYMGTAAIEIIRREFTWDQKAQKLVNVYRQTLSRRSVEMAASVQPSHSSH